MPATSPPREIGVIGVGRMGLPISARLAEQGHAVVATDVRRELAPAVMAARADWVDSLDAIGARCDLVITVLPGPTEVAGIRDVLIAALSPGSTWIDMSTATATVAADIATAASRRTVRTLDAPVGGGPVQARAGRLLALVGASVEDLRSHRGILDVLADRVLHVGPVGSGYTVKLLVNLLWFGQAVAGAEALSLAARAGLDPETVRQAVQQSAAANRFMDQDASALMRGENLTSFSLAGCVEELASVLRLGGQHDVRLSLGERVAEMYAEALKHYGDVDGELLAARRVTELANVEFGSDVMSPPRGA